MASTVGKISNRVLSVMAGLSAFVLTLLGFLLLGTLNQQVVASLLIGLFALMIVHLAAERPNSAHARAVAALIDRLLAVSRGDLSSPAPAGPEARHAGARRRGRGPVRPGPLQPRRRPGDGDVRSRHRASQPGPFPARGRAHPRHAGDSGAALLFIDLDGFKEVNDRLGHAQGDQVLVMVANRLRVVLKAEVADGTLAPPLLARLAGDEFTMLLPEVSTREEAERIATGALAALAEPFKPAGQSVLIGGSIGIALAPDHGTDLTSLMKAADIAMYHAKASGRSRLCSYEPQPGPSVRGARRARSVGPPRASSATSSSSSSSRACACAPARSPPPRRRSAGTAPTGAGCCRARRACFRRPGLPSALGEWTLDAVSDGARPLARRRPRPSSSASRSPPASSSGSTSSSACAAL